MFNEKFTIMKRLTKVEKAILEMVDSEKYNSYRCPEHGVYKVRKDLPMEKQVCAYCKGKNEVLSDEEIKQLINK